jgi:hypothetical protein
LNAENNEIFLSFLLISPENLCQDSAIFKPFSTYAIVYDDKLPSFFLLEQIISYCEEVGFGK